MDASNMGNFKGVMLCNRPTQSAAPASSGGGGDGMMSKPAFISTVSKNENLGLNPIQKEQVSKVQGKNKEDDVTWKHKQWLAEFSEKQSTQKLSEEEKKQAIEDNKKKFAEKAALQRQQLRQAKEQGLGEEGIKLAMTGKLPAAEKPEEDDSKEKEVAKKESKKDKKKKKELKAKPKWALTAEEAEEVEDLEVDDLLDFAANLDFDEFIDDMEEKEAMRYVEEKIRKLEAEEAAEDGDEGDLDEDAPVEEILDDEGNVVAEPTLSQRVAQMKRKMAAKAKKTRKKVDDDTVSMGSHMSSMSHMSTESRLLNEGGLKGVHSAASVRALMKKAAKKEAKGTSLDKIAEGGGITVQEPVVVTNKARDISNKNTPSNLPYLFRHPAA